MKLKSLLILTAATYLSIQNVSAQSDQQLANNLIKLRGQVEDLQSELKILKSEHTNSMAYLNTRKTELSANVDRKELQIKQSEMDMTKLQEKIKNLGTDSELLIPDVEVMLDELEASLTSGIPFKIQERKSVVEEIRRKLQSDKITAQNAVNQIWAFIEDEIRLTRENAIYSQTIELNGENVLAEVAKIGTVLMYFKTRDEKFGSVEKTNGKWNYKIIEDVNESQQVATLFESLKKQIRQGYFTLPLKLTVGK